MNYIAFEGLVKAEKPTVQYTEPTCFLDVNRNDVWVRLLNPAFSLHQVIKRHLATAHSMLAAV